jgi:hypothetical protein
MDVKAFFNEFRAAKQEFNDRWKKNFPLVPPPSISVLPLLKFEVIVVCLVVCLIFMIFLIVLTSKPSRTFG